MKECQMRQLFIYMYNGRLAFVVLNIGGTKVLVYMHNAFEAYKRQAIESFYT